MTLRLVVIGLVSILGQVALLRELQVAFFGSELVCILALGIWLLGTALGAGLGRRGFRPPAAAVSWLLLGAAVTLPAVVVFVRGSRRLFGAVPGAYLSFPVQIVALALAAIPLGLVLGLLFQRAARGHVARRRTLAAAYAVESAGGLAGGLLAMGLLMQGISNLQTVFVGALLAAGAGLWPPARAPWRRSATGLALVVLLLAGLSGSARLDRASTRWNHPALLLSRDTPYGRITVDADAGQIVLYVNDALAYESQGTAAEEFVHAAALQCADPRRVLILGGGLTGLIVEAAKHHPERLDYVEMNRRLLDLLVDLPLDLGLGSNPDGARSDGVGPTRVIQDDPRSYLARAPAYDLILVGMPEPASGQDNRFYTREFFAQCAAVLAPGGVLAFRLPGAENLWTTAQARRAGSLHRALTDVFPSVVVLPGASNIFLASGAPLPTSAGILAERLAARGIRTRLVSAAYLDYLYTNDRFAETAARLGAPPAATAPANTDARPICYPFTLLLWLSRFLPGVGWLDLPGWTDIGRTPWPWLVLAAGAAALIRLRRSDIGRRTVPLFVAGAAGMIIETVLLLDHQAHSGALYRDMGLLITLFMAGLALGAATIGRISARYDPVGRLGPGLWLALILLCAVGGGLVANGAIASLAATGAVLVAGAFLTAGLFAHLSLRGRPPQDAMIAPLYVADLAGGCAGSLAASLVMIPMLGLAGALWVTAGMAVVGLFAAGR